MQSLSSMLCVPACNIQQAALFMGKVPVQAHPIYINKIFSHINVRHLCIRSCHCMLAITQCASGLRTT